jgi:phage terminase large subunit
MLELLQTIERRTTYLDRYLPKPVLRLRASQSTEPGYRFDPERYIKEKLGYSVWSGQQSVLTAYTLALRQQHERRDYENGLKTEEQLETWKPGQVVQNWISVDAGHNIGKTFLGAAIVSHFFDAFAQSITYCFAPSWEQINDLLFKEVRHQRANKGLPGNVLQGEPRINDPGNAKHFVTGKATNNDKGSGSERTHGQHDAYQLFIVDEAEAVPQFVFDAIRSMSSGGISVILVLRNPRTTICEAHKIRKLPNVCKFRISELDHPNVREDREIIPGSVRRQYILDMLPGCERVNEHDPDEYTFELPWQPDVIYRPSLEFLWRVLGIASSKGTDDTFCPPGRYEAATTRTPYDGDDIADAWLGIDAARYGNDKGTIYIRHLGRVWKDSEISKQDGFEYYLKAKAACEKLKQKGVKRIRVRVDGGGGYGSTCIDNLRRDADLAKDFESFQVFEVHNNGTPKDQDKYADAVTEMYAYAGEALKVLRLENPPPNLETDLCERKYKYVIKTSNGKTRLDVKQLVPKEKFKEQFGRSPDDGDGMVLAVVADYLVKYRGATSGRASGLV